MGLKRKQDDGYDAPDPSDFVTNTPAVSTYSPPVSTVPVYQGSEPVTLGGATGRQVDQSGKPADTGKVYTYENKIPLQAPELRAQSQSTGGAAVAGYNGIPDIAAQAQVIQYVTTMLNNMMQATGYVYKYTGMVQGIPQFEQLKDADGNLMRTDQWLTNEATRQNYIAQQVARQRELDIAKQNADTQTAQTRLSRDQTLASLASDPTKMVQGAMLANLYGTRSGSVPAAFGWQAGAPAPIGQYDRASTATGAGAGATGVTAQGLTTTGAGTGGTATATNLSYNVADVANLRDATSVGLSPQVRAALAGGRVSATGNPSGWMGASSNLNLAVPLSGDFGRIGVDQWNRMDAASKAQYVSLAQANQPGLTADLLDAQIKRQSPGSAAGYGGM